MRYTRRLACMVVVAAFVPGCTVGPEYVRPQIDSPQAFRFADKDARDTANTEWWKQFQDPVLDALIAEALANNKSIKIAAANVEQAAGVLQQTRSAFYPQVGYQGAGTRQQLSESNGSPAASLAPNPRTSYQALAGASWEIDLWGRIRRQSESAQATLFATEQARRGVLLSLVGTVASSYLQLRGLDQQLEISRRTLATYAESVRLFDLQFKYGVISKMTVEQARSQYEAAAAQVPQLEAQAAQTENALSILLGRNPGPIQRGKSLVDLALPAVPAGLPSDVLERRPDIAQAEQQLIAANARIGAAKALYYPTISLTGTFGGASAELSDLFSGPAGVWSFAGAVAGPIFTGGAIAGTVAQAEAAQKAALLSYELAIQSAFADVENALVSRAKTAEQLQAQERLVQSLREYERLARLQYDGGYTPYLTVLNAQQQLFPAELNYVLNRAQTLNALVGLYKAMGGGWIVEADRLAAQAAGATRP
jgi:multidrug efflux system outer membrane protein